MADVLERDAGFCSGGDEDDVDGEDDIHSPTDASEDSVDVKVQAISFRNRNKRKCAEPRKLDSELPAKKRKMKDLTLTRDDDDDDDVREPSNSSPFRPWSTSPQSSPSQSQQRMETSVNRINLKSDASVRTKNSNTGNGDKNVLNVIPLSRLTESDSSVPVGGCCQPVNERLDEPLSLVSKRKEENNNVKVPIKFSFKNKNYSPDVRLSSVPSSKSSNLAWNVGSQKADETNATEWESTERKSYLINRVNKLTNGKKGGGDKKTKTDVKTKMEDVANVSGNCNQSDNKFRIDSLLSSSSSSSPSSRPEGTSSSIASTSKSSSQERGTLGGGHQRNYKNMTRERRIEANARERTRVHTISAAFDTLRHSIPAYSHNQKLSKLSVLRIACSYIMTLSRLAGYDYSKNQSEPDLSDCVDNVSKTIQTEGKIRKKRED
ncbi:bhlh factor math6, putative [Pediculus humanus corporis]|uniref:Bhlh factor math6, putative n=1 Tax=Pediculus humanus subsp. corporis TaxID=121224 RepID=E0VE92_PEDHC|nr:bhlh factor math6, putative [Pediculus humanus corporis]EEB11698.1 bhlh factor math6, putative [Pediculus humanus corporis]